MLVEIKNKAINPSNIVRMEKDEKYNNIGNSKLYRLRVIMPPEIVDFVYPDNASERDEDFNRLLKYVNERSE